MAKITLDQLPVMSENILPLDALVPEGWWQAPDNLLPVVVRPQLNQELGELVEFARMQSIALAPIGRGSLGFRGYADPRKEVSLLVQPGFTHVWSGPDKVNQTAFFPAGMTLAEAEQALNEYRYTLSLWPQDQGSVGGNWVMPRGSFGTREFLNPAARRLGVEVLFLHGEWMNTSEAPRSAAGPNIARFLAGSGGAVGLVTGVRLAIRPFETRRYAVGQFDDVARVLRTIRDLVMQDYLPTALSLYWDGCAGRLEWQQMIGSGWDARSLQAAVSQLDLQEQDDPLSSGGSKENLPVLRNWKELLALAEHKKGRDFPGELAGPTPVGMIEFMQEYPPVPNAWADWLDTATRAGCSPVLTEA